MQKGNAPKKRKISHVVHNCQGLRKRGLTNFCFYLDKLDSYLKTTQDHYHSSFLSSLPVTLQVQDDVVFHRKLNMGNGSHSGFGIIWKTTAVKDTYAWRLMNTALCFRTPIVSEPSLDEGVFCRINEDIGNFQLTEYVVKFEGHDPAKVACCYPLYCIYKKEPRCWPLFSLHFC